MSDLEITLSPTPPAWAKIVLQNQAALLADHVHLEKKAASNALALLPRPPQGADLFLWSDALARIAKEEMQHFRQVLAKLRALGGELPVHHQNTYALELHRLLRRGRGPLETLDRLLASAVIEARSLERFQLLARFAPPELSRFYHGLETSEKGHAEAFLKLAQTFFPGREVALRLADFVEEDAKALARLPAAASILSGLRME